MHHKCWSEERSDPWNQGTRTELTKRVMSIVRRHHIVASLRTSVMPYYPIGSLSTNQRIHGRAFTRITEREINNDPSRLHCIR
jgi:hypothetical protein